VWVDAPTGRQHFCGLVIRTHLEGIITSRRFQSAPLPQNPPPTPADLRGCAALRYAALASPAGAVRPRRPTVALAERIGAAEYLPWYTEVRVGANDRTKARITAH
jgi:hypothetical protein